MRGTISKQSRSQISSTAIAVMLWLILIIIYAMWAVPYYVGQPLAGL